LSSLRDQRVAEVNALEAMALDRDFLRAPEEECLATFWRQASPGVAYWRCELAARYLPGQMIGFDIKEVAWDDQHDRLSLPAHRGAAVWQFMGDDVRARVALAWQDLGYRTLMEVDDNYTQSPGKWGVSWTKDHADSKTLIGYSHEQHRHLCTLVDGIIVSTPYLADLYSTFNDNIFVCRNSIEPADWPEYEKPDDGVFRIVFAGSAIHIFDYPMVKKALKWAQRQKDVEVTLMGFSRPPAFDGEVVSWVDSIDTYRVSLGKFDLGIAPLINNRWNRGKSDIKAMEYAMMGAMPLPANVEAYRPWTDMGWPSPSTEDDWIEMIQYAVRNRDWVKEQAAVAKEYVLNERVIWKEVPRWREAIA